DLPRVALGLEPHAEESLRLERLFASRDARVADAFAYVARRLHLTSARGGFARPAQPEEGADDVSLRADDALYGVELELALLDAAQPAQIARDLLALVRLAERLHAHLLPLVDAHAVALRLQLLRPEALALARVRVVVAGEHTRRVAALDALAVVAQNFLRRLPHLSEHLRALLDGVQLRPDREEDHEQ